MSINGHKTSCTRTMYINKKEKKRYKASLLHPSTKITYVYKLSQDLMYKNNVSKQERKEKIQSILTTSLNKNNTPPNKNV